MIALLLVASLLSAQPGGASRPRPSTGKVAPQPAPRQAPEPKPEPEPAAEPDSDPEPEPDLTLDSEPSPELSVDDGADDPFSGRTRRSKLNDSQAAAVGFATLCCCFLVFVGLVALIVFLVRRSNAKPSASAVPTANAAAPSAATAPPAVAPVPAAAGFHLSVLALGLHSPARATVAQQLLLQGIQADPLTPAERTQLVRELAKALRGLETEWTHFGYGERLDLLTEAAAQNSYQLAVDDFSRRSGPSSSTADSSHVVVTLVLCTRRQLAGVSALDDRSQIRVLLEQRSSLPEAELMGAFVVWSAPLGGHEVITRFPEMHAVR